MKFEGKKSPRGPQRDKLLRIKGKNIAFDDVFLGGSSSCDSFTHRRITEIQARQKPI